MMYRQAAMEISGLGSQALAEEHRGTQQIFGVLPSLGRHYFLAQSAHETQLYCYIRS